jgi:hypothetical protein
MPAEDLVSLSPIELISAHPWRRVTFTTYALSLSFFEAVLLDALIRGGGHDRLILADIEGVRASLSEQGATRVGKDYEVEPVHVNDGVFHPKISVLRGDDDCHLLIGSGNLTFGGWGGNFEVLEHLHPSFAADAILDTADFFERLSDTGRIQHGAADHCHAIADELRSAIGAHPRNGDIRLYHSLDGAIAEKVAQAVQDLGGAQRLIVASPFWDTGAAVDRLCKSIGLDHAYVHAHPGDTVKGTAGANWPARTDIAVKAIRLEVMDEAHLRRLHAKAFEVICKRGRILLSGSANATTAALSAGRNVEASVARIQRERIIGWRFAPAEPPDFVQSQEPIDDNDAALPGVLRATLEGDRISGQVLTPKSLREVSVFQISAEGRVSLGPTSLGEDGKFLISAPELEAQAWKGGRLVLRVEAADGRASEGFVSVSAFSELSRRLGPFGSRLIPLLAGIETPADVAAIMSWFYEDPRRLGGTPTDIRESSANGDSKNELGATIAIAELKAGEIRRSSSVGALDDGGPRWSRFMDYVMAAFREPRGPLGGTSSGRRGEDDEDEDPHGGADPPPVDPAIDRSFKNFDRLFDRLLSGKNAARDALIAFDLTQYVCERLQPDAGRANAWLQRLIDALLAYDVPNERRADVAAAILTQLGLSSPPGSERHARARLLTLHYDLAGGCPSPPLAQGFQSVLIQTTTFAELWARVQSIRTFSEQAGAYLCALDAGHPSKGYEDLMAEALEEHGELEDAFRSEQARSQLLVLKQWSDACPRCHIALPTGERSRLRSQSVARAKNCCGRVLIWPGN